MQIILILQKKIQAQIETYLLKKLEIIDYAKAFDRNVAAKKK